MALNPKPWGSLGFGVSDLGFMAFSVQKNGISYIFEEGSLGLGVQGL